MKEIRKIVQSFSGIDLSQTQAALVTVIDIQGSSYRRRGARMLVLDDGTYLGGISGGCLEGDALKRAKIAILKGKPSVLRYDTTEGDDNQIGVGLGCNGIIDVLFTPLDESESNPLKILSGLLEIREAELMITIITKNNEVSGQCFLFKGPHTPALKEFESSPGILADITECSRSLESKFATYQSDSGPVSLFIEVVKPETRLILVGSNYDILPTTRIAKELGWELFLITNISRISKELFEITDNIIDIKKGEVPVTDVYTAVVLMSHDYKTDLSFLPKFLNSPVFYIGLLGPKKRAERLFADIGLDYNKSSYDFSRIHGPAGLDIGASTPEEIGLSIIAEIKAISCKKEAGSLKHKKGTIYAH